MWLERFGRGCRCLCMSNISGPWHISHVDAVAAPPESRRWAGGAARGMCLRANRSQLLYPDNPFLPSGRTSHTQFSFSACCFRKLMRHKGVKHTTLVVCPPILKRVFSVIWFVLPMWLPDCVPCFCLTERNTIVFTKKKKKLACKRPAPYSRLWFVLTVFASWAKTICLSISTSFPYCVLCLCKPFSTGHAEIWIDTGTSRIQRHVQKKQKPSPKEQRGNSSLCISAVAIAVPPQPPH